MSKNQCLRCLAFGRDTVNEVSEDDCLAGTSSQRDSKTLVSYTQIGEDGLNAFFLILA
jgi:hypothetical protein